MAIFTRSPQKPDSRVWLKDPSDLGRISRAQFKEEKDFWERVHKVGGFFQMELGEIILRDVLNPLGNLINLQKMPPETPRHKIGNGPERGILAGLALAHLVRKVHGFEELKKGKIGGPAQYLEGIDFDVRGLQPVTYLHERVDRVTDFIPDYDSAANGAWYEDETLILRAFHPAKPTGTFKESMRGVLGEPFDPAHHVTLRPHLKLDYIQS